MKERDNFILRWFKKSVLGLTEENSPSETIRRIVDKQLREANRATKELIDLEDNE